MRVLSDAWSSRRGGSRGGAGAASYTLAGVPGGERAGLGEALPAEVACGGRLQRRFRGFRVGETLSRPGATMGAGGGGGSRPPLVQSPSTPGFVDTLRVVNDNPGGIAHEAVQEPGSCRFSRMRRRYRNVSRLFWSYSASITVGDAEPAMRQGRRIRRRLGHSIGCTGSFGRPASVEAYGGTGILPSVHRAGAGAAGSVCKALHPVENLEAGHRDGSDRCVCKESDHEWTAAACVGRR